MEENNNIDDLFRSSIEPFKMDPSEDVWSSLDARLEKRKAVMQKKRSGRFLWLLPLLLLISFGAYEYFSPSQISNTSGNNLSETTSHKKSTDGIVENNKSETSSASVADHAADNSNATKELTGQSIVKDNNSDKELSEKLAAKNSEKNISKETDYPHEKLVAHENKNANKNSSDKIIAQKNEKQSLKKENKIPSLEKQKSKLHLITSEKTTVQQKEIKETDSKKNENRVSDEREKYLPKDAYNVSEANINSNANRAGNETASNEKSDEQKKDLVSQEKSDDANEGKINLKEENSLAAVEPEKSDSINLVQADSVKKNPEANISKSWLRKIKAGLSAELFYSPNYGTRYLAYDNTYSGTDQSQSEYYKNEKPNYSFSTGLRLRYDLSSKWSIGTGATYSTYSQSSTTNNVYVESDSAYKEDHGHHHGGDHGHGSASHDSLHYIVHTSCGTIDLHNYHHSQGSASDGDTLSITTQTTEQIYFISIPLVVRFHVMKNKFGYYFEAGASANYAVKNEVKINIADIYNQTGSIDGLKNMNFSLLFGAGIQYRFYKGLNTFLEPNLRYSITPINQNNAVLSYPYFIGVRMGLSVHF